MWGSATVKGSGGGWWLCPRFCGSTGSIPVVSRGHGKVMTMDLDMNGRPVPSYTTVNTG